MSRSPYEELVWQLERLPGGVAAAIPDFFGHLLLAPPERQADLEVWRVQDAQLLLRRVHLSVRHGETETDIATLPTALMESASNAGLSPLLLGLLALASGDLPGDKRLNAVLPKVDGAAKDLMLMTVCRLCG